MESLGPAWDDEGLIKPPDITAYRGRATEFERVTQCVQAPVLQLESNDTAEHLVLECIRSVINYKIRDRQAEIETAVISQRYGFRDAAMTLEQVASILGVTRERVRQIETRALAHLAQSRFCRTNVVASHLAWLTFNDNLILPGQSVPTFTPVMYRLLSDAYPSAFAITIDKQRDLIFARPWQERSINEMVDSFDRNYFTLGFSEAIKMLERHVPFGEDHVSKDRVLCRLNSWATQKAEHAVPATRIELLTAALREIGGPAHFLTIAKFAAAIERRQFSRIYARNIHAALGLHPDTIARPGGHGIFALKSLGVENTFGLKEEIRKILGEHVGWMSAEQILDLLPNGSAFTVASISMTLSLNLDVFRRAIFFSLWSLLSNPIPASKTAVDRALASFLSISRSATRLQCHVALEAIADTDAVDTSIINNSRIIRIGSARDSLFILYSREVPRTQTKAAFLRLIMHDYPNLAVKAAMIYATTTFNVQISGEHAINVLREKS